MTPSTPEQNERDGLWCLALLSTLPIELTNKVLTRVLKLRDDPAAMAQIAAFSGPPDRNSNDMCGCGHPRCLHGPPYHDNAPPIPGCLLCKCCNFSEGHQA